MRRSAIKAFFAGVCLALAAGQGAAWELHSYAAVNADGSLQIERRTVYLYGIHIPVVDETCDVTRLPRVCGSRAVIALQRKIQGFVKCEILGEHADATLVGVCRVDSSPFRPGTDLGAYLLEEGWAVALPEASIDYQTLEKVARARSYGLWGLPVDTISW